MISRSITSTSLVVALGAITACSSGAPSTSSGPAPAPTSQPSSRTVVVERVDATPNTRALGVARWQVHRWKDGTLVLRGLDDKGALRVSVRQFPRTANAGAKLEIVTAAGRTTLDREHPKMTLSSDVQQLVARLNLDIHLPRPLGGGGATMDLSSCTAGCDTTYENTVTNCYEDSDLGGVVDWINYNACVAVAQDLKNQCYGDCAINNPPPPPPPPGTPHCTSDADCQAWYGSNWTCADNGQCAGATSTITYCGDGTCNPYEDCSSCPQDCGSCGGGGGGGGCYDDWDCGGGWCDGGMCYEEYAY